MKAQRNTSLGFIVLLAIIGLAVGVIAAAAQNIPANHQNIPPTAREAAKLPQFAAKLAQQGPHRQSERRRLQACSPSRQGVERPGILPDYSNGGINGTTDAWTINFGFVTADSFPVGGGTVNSFSFGAWVFPGDVLQTVEVSITSQPFGGTTYFDGVVSFSQSGCFGNQYGYNVCTESGSFSGPGLSSGTYWVNLQNAVTTAGNPLYWDENSGPSLAETNSVGTIPSESFTIGGGGNTCMPEQSGNFKVIHDFNGVDGAGPSGVVIDSFGNLYGATTSGGGSGSVYKLALAGSRWVLSNLYDFIGGTNGNSPAGAVDHDGVVYGAAAGGLQNCNSGHDCGLIFRLRPSPTVCLTSLCPWKEDALYHFTGSTDAWQGGNLVVDSAGNLYGVSSSGGAQQHGAVFEVSPSIGSWSETILYSFTGNADGGSPTDIIVGNDGNLYGMAEWGGAYGGGVVFQLTRSANGWTETVLYDLPYMSWGWGTNPHSLLQDSSGNLIGIYEYGGCCDSAVGSIFMLSPSNGTWVFTELHHGNADVDGNDVFPNMTMDAAGNLHGTESIDDGCISPVDYGYVFELAPTGNGWQYTTPVGWEHTYFPASGALAIDAQGNLYGTTGYCGASGQGTVWELSP